METIKSAIKAIIEWLLLSPMSTDVGLSFVPKGFPIQSHIVSRGTLDRIGTTLNPKPKKSV